MMGVRGVPDRRPGLDLAALGHLRRASMREAVGATECAGASVPGVGPWRGARTALGASSACRDDGMVSHRGPSLSLTATEAPA